MIYHILYLWHDDFSWLNVFRYISFRAIYATLTALVLTFVIGPWLIEKLKLLSIKQQIRNDGPANHLSKQGTPTMGGILIIFSVAVSTLLWGNLSVSYVWVALLVMIAFGAVGFIDDYRKLINRSSKGLAGRKRLALESAIALGVGFFLLGEGLPTTIALPFFKNLLPDLGIFYIFVVVFIIVGCANAVNLTDGLDGLAIGPIIICSLTYLLLAYFAGNYKLAGYLMVPFVSGAGELAVFCGALVGAGIGFLWFNTYPAQVFMGDVGSLSLGGALGVIAVMAKQEILLAIVGGVFVLEALSVILQVSWFKVFKGERFFRMAPIHHHFELGGWTEPKVIVRFWIVSIILALIAISTLKLR
ncbi:MAG: phospho-N-acetylmuramoyl-pentapeptide-transferase [Deltaproteobacteria bacterium]|nr:phospho-N-acetylmuramoyl-pentapeptide-transferase [Deltaproteobacteria bacterium]